MKEKSIVFTIGDGRVEIEAEGFQGPACEAATKAFEEALGGEITGKVKKPEYTQRAVQSTGARQGAGR